MRNDMRLFNRNINGGEGMTMTVWMALSLFWFLICLFTFIFGEWNLVPAALGGVLPAVIPWAWFVGVVTARDARMTNIQRDLLYRYQRVPKELRKQIPLDPEVIAMMSGEEAAKQNRKLEELVNTYNKNLEVGRAQDQRLLAYNDKVTELTKHYKMHTEEMQKQDDFMKELR